MTALTERFNAPPQDLSAPSRFPADRSALGNWLEMLPKNNLGQTVRSLYNAVAELNRVQLAPLQRLLLLEELRAAIHLASTGLRSHYLNQPIALPEHPAKVAQLVQQLSEHLATGYALAAAHAIEQGLLADAQSRVAIATALQRAIVEHSLNLLIDCQLYRAARPGCWRQLHVLAALAREHRLEQVAVPDFIGDCSIESAYLRALLLGSANAHQMRQDSIERTYQQLLSWSRYASLCEPEAGLFCFDPLSDTGPIYRELCSPGPGWLGLNTAPLAEYLLEQAGLAGRSAVEEDLSRDLTLHLVHAWSAAGKRVFLRMVMEDEIQVCVGLACTHHFVSGELDFKTLLGLGGSKKFLEPAVNPFLRLQAPAIERRHGGKDVWGRPYAPSENLARLPLESIDYQIHEHDKARQDVGKYRYHTALTENVSPGGFCLKWPTDSAAQLRTGEIIGVRSRGQDSWNVGVVRWVRVREGGPRVGIELLSPAASAYGARVVRSKGPQGEYLRVLALPEISQLKKPPSLIMPRLPFRAGQKVSLVHRDQETRVQLTRRVSSSAAFSQFEFRRLGTAPARLMSDGFELLWENL